MTSQNPRLNSVENTYQHLVREEADVLSFPVRTEEQLRRMLENMAATPAGSEAIIEMAGQIVDKKLARRKLQMHKPALAGRYFKARLGNLEHEAFAVMFLDSTHHVLGFEVLFRGTIDKAAIYPREVVKEALRYNASGVVLGHNHPSGNSQPSADDLHLTQKLKEALAVMQITTVDHVIVGFGEPYSMHANSQL